MIRFRKRGTKTVRVKLTKAGRIALAAARNPKLEVGAQARDNAGGESSVVKKTVQLTR